MILTTEWSVGSCHHFEGSSQVMVGDDVEFKRQPEFGTNNECIGVFLTKGNRCQVGNVRVSRAIVMAPLFDERSIAVESAIVIAKDFKIVKSGRNAGKLGGFRVRVDLSVVTESREEFDRIICIVR
jgi:hypothetical protein